jgi:hypothetical protein
MIAVKQNPTGFKEYTPQEINNWAGNKNLHIARNESDIRNFVERAITDKDFAGKLLLGKIDNYLADKIKTETGVDLRDYNLELRAVDIRHIFKRHGSDTTESPRGQRAVTADDIINFKNIVGDFDDIIVSAGKKLTFIKNANGKVSAITIYANRSRSLSLKTMWVNIKGRPSPGF